MVQQLKLKHWKKVLLRSKFATNTLSFTMKFTNGLTLVSTISDVLQPPIKPSTISLTIFVSICCCILMSHVELQDCSRYFLKIASQQLLDGGYYGTAVMRALQDVTIFSFLNFSETMFNVIPWKSLILTDSWLIDSWKALVPCVVTKMLGVINVTSVASWSTPLNSSYQGVKCVVILQWLRHPNIYFSIYLSLYNNLTFTFFI